MKSVWDGGGHRAELTNKQQVRQAGRLEKPVSLPPPCSWLEGLGKGNGDPNLGPNQCLERFFSTTKENGSW